MLSAPNIKMCPRFSSSRRKLIHQTLRKQLDRFGLRQRQEVSCHLRAACIERDFSATQTPSASS